MGSARKGKNRVLWKLREESDCEALFFMFFKVHL